MDFLVGRTTELSPALAGSRIGAEEDAEGEGDRRREVMGRLGPFLNRATGADMVG